MYLFPSPCQTENCILPGPCQLDFTDGPSSSSSQSPDDLAGDGLGGTGGRRDDISVELAHPCELAADVPASARLHAGPGVVEGQLAGQQREYLAHTDGLGH